MDASSRSSGPTIPRAQTAADKVKVDADKARQWIAKGATPSDTVQSLLKQAGVFQTAGRTASVGSKTVTGTNDG